MKARKSRDKSKSGWRERLYKKKKKERKKRLLREIELFLLLTCSPRICAWSFDKLNEFCTTFAQPLILGPVDRLLSGERRWQVERQPGVITAECSTKVWWSVMGSLFSSSLTLFSPPLPPPLFALWTRVAWSVYLSVCLVRLYIVIPCSVNGNFCVGLSPTLVAPGLLMCQRSYLSTWYESLDVFSGDMLGYHTFSNLSNFVAIDFGTFSPLNIPWLSKYAKLSASLSSPSALIGISISLQQYIVYSQILKLKYVNFWFFHSF